MKFDETWIPVEYVEEPGLIFGYGQTMDNPKDGLFLYGPMNGTRALRPVRLGVIGTNQGLEFFDQFIDEVSHPISIPERGPRDKSQRLHLTPFPGLAEAMGLSIDTSQLRKYELPLSKINQTTSILNKHEAVSKTVDLYINVIKRHLDREEQSIDVWVVVVPEIVFDRCRPESARTNVELKLGDFHKRKTAPSSLPLLAEIVDLTDEKIFEDVADFHRQLKAKLLVLRATSQVFRETTLSPSSFINPAGYPIRRTQDRSTIAWNFCSSLYYKSQPSPPWKMASAREGVCYVGLAFKVIPNHPQEHACCAAQMFLSEGDGVVFRGAVGPWKSGDYDFHLSRDEAAKLIRLVIETYVDHHNEPPRELFIHSQAKFSEDEWEGFCEGTSEETNVITVRIRPTSGDIKLFRDGDYPCLRGIAMMLDEYNAFLWSAGYTPGIDTYVGPETPNPISVTLLNSTEEMPLLRTVLFDILGLTKINYNACHYNDGLPVTIRFADKIGNILTMRSAEGATKQQLKYYI